MHPAEKIRFLPSVTFIVNFSVVVVAFKGPLSDSVSLQNKGESLWPCPLSKQERKIFQHTHTTCMFAVYYEFMKYERKKRTVLKSKMHLV